MPKELSKQQISLWKTSTVGSRSLGLQFTIDTSGTGLERMEVIEGSGFKARPIEPMEPGGP